MTKSTSTDEATKQSSPMLSARGIAAITCFLSLMLQIHYLNFASTPVGPLRLRAHAEVGLYQVVEAEPTIPDNGEIATFEVRTFPNASEVPPGQTFTEVLEEFKCKVTSFCYQCLHHKHFWQKGGPELCAHRGCQCVADLFGTVRPKPMPVATELRIKPPAPKTGKRLIPRIIHQTYKMELNQEDHPNWSRFQNSWKHSGWDYRYYPNNKAGMYLARHFPPEVKEAYDAIVPGAYKADLFRLCVLLLHGGMYVDIDILPHLNPDVMIEPDVGFAIPLDYIPGAAVNNTPMLWNGFMAVSPGHPAIAKAVETMVNAINNRHQGFDFDYRMVDDLDYIYLNHDNAPLQWGPGLLGFALNRALGRRAQQGFDVGTMPHSDDLPGKTVILRYNQDVNDLTTIADNERNLLMATTSLSGYEFESNTKNHYSAVADHNIAFGSKGVYVDQRRQGREIRIIVEDPEGDA